VLHQALGLFQDHFRHLDVALGRLVKGGTDHFGLDAALHVRHFFGPLVDEQHDEHDLGVIGGDAVGQVLEQHGLAGAGSGDDETPLAHAHGGHQVHDPGGEVVRVGLELEPLVGIEGRQVIEEDLVPGHRGVLKIDRLHLEEGEIALPFLGRADLPGDGVPGAQIEAAYLGR
jgi:hypothetical protein